MDGEEDFREKCEVSLPDDQIIGLVDRNPRFTKPICRASAQDAQATEIAHGSRVYSCRDLPRAYGIYIQIF